VSITRRDFPKVQAQIVQQLSGCRKRFESLGVDRESTDQERRFLLEISREFQDITNSALDAYYSRNQVFKNMPELRLATLAVDRMERFSEEIEERGHIVSFDSQDGEEELATTGSPTPSASGSEEDAKTLPSQYQELLDVIPGDWEIPEPSERKIMGWIEEEFRKARGFDLGTIGPSILLTL
jgi:hypothetical protein